MASPYPAPLAVDERECAAAIGMSVAWLRKDRRTKRVIPFFKMAGNNGAVRYNLDRCREALAAIEEGGPKPRAKAS